MIETPDPTTSLIKEYIYIGYVQIVKILEKLRKIGIKHRKISDFSGIVRLCILYYNAIVVNSSFCIFVRQAVNEARKWCMLYMLICYKTKSK